MHLIELPSELILCIAAFLSNECIIRLSETCKCMWNICSDSRLWKKRYLTEFPRRFSGQEEDDWKIYLYDTRKVIWINGKNIYRPPKGADSVAYSRQYWYDRHSWRSSIVTNGWSDQLDCEEKWNWNPEEESDTEWITEGKKRSIVTSIYNLRKRIRC